MLPYDSRLFPDSFIPVNLKKNLMNKFGLFKGCHVLTDEFSVRVTKITSRIDVSINLWHSYSMWDKPGWLNQFWQFLCFLSFIQKDSSTNIHDLTVYVKKELPFAQNLSLENSTDSYLGFQLAFLHSVSNFFFLYQSPSLFLCTVFDFI